MNEEEKNAIRDLRNNIQFGLIGDGTSLITNETATTILNLIEKQQAEIGRLTTNNEILQGELDRIGIKTLKLKKGSSTDDIITEIEKKDTLINTMQAEFERLENLEDDTDMLKLELKKRNKMIDLMASAIDNYDCQLEINSFKDKQHIKQVFREEVENNDRSTENM